MSRVKLLAICLLCALVAPVLVLMMFLQALAGSAERALRMAIAFDGCGNALFGGDPTMTISARTGLALLDGKRWARIVAPVIDFAFGKGHCMEKAMKAMS